MKTHNSNLNLRLGVFAVVLFAMGATARSADKSNLKDAYKDHFYVGVAINRTIATGAAVRADNVNRTLEQVNKDIAVTKEQFNQPKPAFDAVISEATNNNKETQPAIQ